jgi:hypothetical protein
MFEKFSRSWSLVKASADVLRAERSLLLFPVLSSLATLLVMASFAVPVFALKLFGNGVSVLGVVVALLFYFCQYSVIVFFNSALVGAATIRLDGGDPTVADGLRLAQSKLPTILGYAAIAATVGVLLQSLRNRDNNLIVRMIGSGLGVAWTLATFLVVPVLVNRDIGPIDALKESASLLKRTWGENAIGQLGMGAVFGLLVFAVVAVTALLAVLAWQVQPALAIAVIVVGVVGVLLAGVVQSALSGIYSAALYRYATHGEAPAGFGALLQGATTR